MPLQLRKHQISSQTYRNLHNNSISEALHSTFLKLSAKTKCVEAIQHIKHIDSMVKYVNKVDVSGIHNERVDHQKREKELYNSKAGTSFLPCFDKCQLMTRSLRKSSGCKYQIQTRAQHSCNKTLS